MGSTFRRIFAFVLAGGGLSFSGMSAWAQSAGPLGGYGAASNYASSGSAGGSLMIIPYGGMTEGFMPSRAGGGSSLSLRSRSNAAMGSTRTSFSLSPVSGGMGQGFGTRGGLARPFGTGGMGRPSSGGGLARPLGSGSGMGGAGMGQRASGGVMPPSIGYPFRQPPSLVPSSAPGSGMSM